jgi:HSP20 family molecular chaperone IbpA
MEVVEKKKKELKENDGKDQIRYRVHPDIYKSINYTEKKVDIEVALPGVKKEDIKLKALPTWFKLSATRNSVEFAANSSFGIEVIPDKTSAEYSNGLLKIHAIVKDPLDSAVEIEI